RDHDRNVPCQAVGRRGIGDGARGRFHEPEWCIVAHLKAISIIYNDVQFYLIRMLKLQQLRQFVIAAHSGSFRLAATTTFRSPAAGSIAMRELEKTVGGALIERNRKGTLTPLGEAVLPLFEELLSVQDLVLGQSQQLAQGEQGSITVAVAPFLAESWLP